MNIEDKKLLEENNLILNTVARIQINSLIVELESLTPKQLKNKTILETYKDSVNNALLFYYHRNRILSESDIANKKRLHDLKEKIQLKILSLELDEINSSRPTTPVIIKKN